jgi:Ca2+-binding EF-hand superfamily protein
MNKVSIKNLYLTLTILVLGLVYLPINAKSNLVLDRYPNAKAAYSLRKLRADYNGAAIKVRRSCDNQTSDIGFNETDSLDKDSLISFLAACPQANSALPLDVASSASAAYSLRKLRNAYTGAAIEVRRADNDLKTDIGFSENGDLDHESLQAHCTSPETDCFVSTWYDQSANANHATATNSQQAQIYIADEGIIHDYHGNIVLKTDGLDDIYSTPVAFNDEHSVFIYSTKLIQSDKGWLGGAAESSFRPIIGNDRGDDPGYIAYGPLAHNSDYDKLIVRFNNTSSLDNDSSIFDAEKLLLTVISAGVNDNISVYKNNSLLDSATAGNAFDYGYLRLFGQSARAERHYAGYTNEIIYYTNDQSTNRNLIEQNIHDYYEKNSSLYLDTWYDQSGNNLDATQSNHNHQARIYLDSNNQIKIFTDGKDDIYPLNFQMNTKHSIFTSLTRGVQTKSTSSAIRPFISSDEDTADGGKFFGYSTSLNNNNSSQDFVYHVHLTSRHDDSSDLSWKIKEHKVFSIISNESDLNVFNADTLLLTDTQNLDKNLGDIYLFGSPANGVRRFMGFSDEMLIYTDDLTNEREHLSYDLGHFYNNFNTNTLNLDLSLANLQVEEGSPSGTLVTNISASPNTELSLIHDSTDSFYISDNKLYTNKTFNHNTKSSFQITIRATDLNSANFIEKSFNIEVLYLDDFAYKFTEAKLEFTSLNNLSPKNTLVSRFTAKNPYINQNNLSFTILKPNKYFYLKDQAIYTKKFIGLTPNIKELTLTLEITDNDTHKTITQDILISIIHGLINRPIDNEENDQNSTDDEQGQSQEDNIDDNNQVVDTEEILSLLDNNRDNKLSFEEITIALVNINRIKFNTNFNSFIKLNNHLHYNRALKNYDLNQDDVIDQTDLTIIDQFLRTYPDYKFIQSLLRNLGTNKKGQVTFRRAKKLLRVYKRTLNSLKSLPENVEPIDKLALRVELFDYNRNQTLDNEDRKQIDILLSIALEKLTNNSSSKRARRIDRLFRNF